MKKVGILTLNGYYNYGNRLQNYAMQEVIKYLGFEAETIKVKLDVKTENKKTYKDRLYKLKDLSFQELIHMLAYKMWFMANKNHIKNYIELRTELFKEFTNEFIVESSFSISDNDIPEDINNRYDFFITGSDQVWNPSYNNGSSIYFLTFAPKHKRIAYTPSFGVSEIMPEFVENYKEWILGMNNLSVREDDGARIIKELTGRDAPVLVDPTLLLTKEKWLSVAKEAKHKPKNKYLLTYFLGGIPCQYKKQIYNIAKKNNLKIINLSNIREKETYISGPSQFIDYINSCSVFCTDSFHGVVFSILFEKPFIVYERMDTLLTMFSRIETLLNKFNLENRKAENIKTNEDVFNIEYAHVPMILEQERKKAINYLKKSLNI